MSRIYLGIDLQQQGLTFAALCRGKSSGQLHGLRFESLDDVFEFSSRQPNVRDTRRFVEGLRRGAQLLAGREERIALSLPDRIGRILLLDVEQAFKSRQEGIDILKWRLKNSLPLPPAQTHIDYQVLERKEDGRQRCLVAAIALPILDQYQDLVNEAGRHAVDIDFHSLNLYNFYRPRLDLGEEFVLVGLQQDQLSFHYFQNRQLAYQRNRVAKAEPEAIFREVNRTLVELYENFGAARRCPVFAHVDPGLSGFAGELLDKAFERQVRLLDSGLRNLAMGAVGGGLEATGTVLAALGCAERLMRA
ncbi:MAG: hypothetical protein RQ723_05000 [Desulfuromonadales bacterium]|nr:hypothetical protein [Desulfuromonadales bacterium]